MSGGVFIVMPEQTIVSYPSAATINTNLPDSHRHLRAIWFAVRDEGCDHLTVAQSAAPFAHLIVQSPTIITVGDDFETSFGPDGFHKKSLREAVNGAAAAAVMAGLSEDAYHSAVSWAVLRRENVLIVETRTVHELVWVNYLREINPNLATLLVSDRNEKPTQ